MRPLLWTLGGSFLAALVFVLSIAALFGSEASGDCGGGAGELGLPKEAERFAELYAAAAVKYELGPKGPAMLASIHRIETRFSENVAVSSAGAQGHMQFMPPTWASYGVDASGDGKADPWNVEDAIYSAANYLKASGAPDDWRGAIYAYNHAGWYVDEVLEYAGRFGEFDPGDVGECAFDGGAGELAWPVEGPVTSPFGPRWGRMHEGIDISASTGTPIHAAQTGRVELAAPTSGYGNYVCIQHAAKLSTCYAHLSTYRARAGTVVSRGEVIGLGGCTGHCFGDHLHFEVRLGPAWSQAVDPMPYLEKRRG